MRQIAYTVSIAPPSKFLDHPCTAICHCKAVFTTSLPPVGLYSLKN